MYKKESVWKDSPPYGASRRMHSESPTPVRISPWNVEVEVEVGKGLPCLRTREWANERVKECSIRRLLGWWRGGERGQTALFIAKQLPVRYFCCNGRRKMKHFNGELIKGPYDKGVLCWGSSNCLLFLFLSRSLHLSLSVSFSLPCYQCETLQDSEIWR